MRDERPYFTIVMPTRNRARTLRHALATACAQEFDDFEVVVSDNHSSDDTEAVVRERGDARIRYVRTPEPLAMTRNWENGLIHAKGRHIVYLSDDDALLPDTLSRACALIEREHAEVAIWHRARYNWPKCLRPDEKNQLVFALPRYEPRWATSAQILEKALRFVDPNETPSLVNSVVKREVFDRLKAKTGSMVLTYSPDTGSGIAIPCVVDRIYMMAEINGLAGISEYSNGAAIQKKGPGRAISDEFHALNGRAGDLKSPFMDELGSCSIAATLDSIHDVARMMPGKLRLELVDMIRVYAQSIVDFDWLDDEEQRRRLTERIYGKVRESHGWPGLLDVWVRVRKGRFTNAINSPRWSRAGSLLRALLGKPYGSPRFYDGDEHGFQDVAGAAKFLHSELRRLTDRRSAPLAALAR